ncbi:primase, DNA, polypeptide 1 (49kDa) [Tyrophagus putrescentiae]|nr:primase, DNA, polypeptide 1 (49kDa) [Tyrophagus putrescentiae]
MTGEYNPNNLNEYLMVYYNNLFPHNLFHRWLSYGNVKKDYFENREFSFTLGGDIYLRYNSFENQQEMRKTICSRLPVKIDLGAVYNMKPKDSKKVKILNFTAEERELVFDIDMTDYDDVRTCCQGTGICPKCWPFMIVAAHILEEYLRCDFGFTNLLWVYSGRRGIHCWVADEGARKLNNNARDAVASFINIFDGGQFKAKKVEIDGKVGCHPSIRRSIQIIDRYFEQLMVKNQDFLDSKERIDIVINLCQDELLRNELRTYLHDPKMRSTKQRWDALVKISQHFYSTSNNQISHQNRNKHKYFVEEGLNHLLKVPFSVHPKTGRICVPIHFPDLDAFDPFTVPTIADLIQEIDHIPKEEGETLGSSRITEKTSLAPSLAIFRAFVKDIEAKLSPAATLLAKSDNKLEF